MLAKRGAATIDADTVYHELIAPGSALTHRLEERFGSSIILSDGSVDRRALAEIVFADSDALADLDALTHPAVIAEIERRVASLTAPVVAIDAVKLIESGMHHACDSVWVVVCEPEQQVTRLVQRNEGSREDAERRVAAQPPVESRVAIADVTIDNSGNRRATRAQVETAWRKLCDTISQQGNRA